MPEAMSKEQLLQAFAEAYEHIIKAAIDTQHNMA